MTGAAQIDTSGSALCTSSSAASSPATTDRSKQLTSAERGRRLPASFDPLDSDWACNITLCSKKEKAEVVVPLEDPDGVVDRMMDKLVNRFPPESVVTVQALRSCGRRSRSVPPRGTKTMTYDASSSTRAMTEVQLRGASVPANLNMSISAAGFPLPYYVTLDGSLLPMAYKSDGTPVEGYVVDGGLVVPVGQQLTVPPRPGKRGLVVDIENNQTEGIALASHGLTRGHPHPHYVLHDGSALPMAYRSDGSPLEGFVQTPRGTATPVGPQYFKDGSAVEGIVIGLDGRPVSGLKLAPQGWAVNVFAPCSTGRASSVDHSELKPVREGGDTPTTCTHAVSHLQPPKVVTVQHRGVSVEVADAHHHHRRCLPVGCMPQAACSSIFVPPVTPSTVVSVATIQHRDPYDDRTPSFARGRSSPPGNRASSSWCPLHSEGTTIHVQSRGAGETSTCQKYTTTTTTTHSPVACKTACNCGCQRVERVERIVEKPHIKYVETEVPVEVVEQKVVHVAKREVLDVPHEVIKYVPKIEERVVEREVHVPGEIVEVKREYEVTERVPVYRYKDEAVPVVVAQVHKPFLRMSGNEAAVSVECKRFEPTLVPVDIFIPKIVDVDLTAAPIDGYHEKVDLPDPHWNGLVRELNRKLALALDQLPMKLDSNGNVPLTAPGRQLGLPVEGQIEALLRRRRRGRSLGKRKGSRGHSSPAVAQGVAVGARAVGSVSQNSLQDFCTFQAADAAGGDAKSRSRCTSGSRRDARSPVVVGARRAASVAPRRNRACC